MPSLAALSTAITFTALLASDNLPPPSPMHTNRNAETLSDVHTPLFAYAFHLEIVVFGNQTGREETQLRSWLPLRHRERARVRHVCMQ